MSPVRYDPGGSAAAATSNTLTEVGPALGLSQRFDQSGTAIGSGFAVSNGPIAIIPDPTEPAVAVSQKIVGVPATVAQTPGFGVSVGPTVLSISQTPTAEIVQIKYDLSHLSGSDTTVNIGTDNWGSGANAQGLHNGTNATGNGNATAARNYIMRLGYANPTGKTGLTITNVQLHFYAGASGTVANNGLLTFAYRLDGTNTYPGATVLQVFTGDTLFSVDKPYDITAAVAGSWTNINNIFAFVQGQTDAGEALIAYQIDAVELTVTATVTDTV